MMSYSVSWLQCSLTLSLGPSTDLSVPNTEYTYVCHLRTPDGVESEIGAIGRYMLVSAGGNSFDVSRLQANRQTPRSDYFP